MAQKYLEVYQNGKVTNSFATTSIDSVGLTGNTSQNRKVNFYRDGKVVSNYLVSGVDSIKVFRSNEEPLVYLGIIGFNQQLYEKPFDVLATSTSNLYQSFVNNLPRKDGTILYYAVDHALDALENYDFKTPIKNVTLVTFTDGLDQGSLMMNNHFTTDEQYLNAVSQRISNTKIKGLPLTAYSLGLVGNDVSNYSLFRKNLNKLASSFEKAFEVSNMDDVQTRLKEISDQIISINTKQTFSMKIPGHSDRTLIRFTLDGSSTDNSSMYIEGTFNLANRSLTNVTYHGIKATTGSFVQGTQDGIFVNFTFTGLQREDGVGLIPTYQTREYYKNVGSNTWQRNSEFSPNNNTQTTITHSGAAIVLVLDCSNSLGSQFSNMRSYANDFINRVATNTSKFEVLAPTNVKAFIPDDNFEIKVTWDAVKHAESYDIYRSEYSSSNFYKVAAGVTSTSWIDETAIKNKSYYYQVVATGHGLFSPQSKTTNAVSLSIDSPRNVTTALLEDAFVINVSWNAVKYAEAYDVYRSKSSSSGFEVVATSLTSTSWIDKSPLKGTNYYKVCASGHGIQSNYSNVTSGIDYYLDIPTNVHASIDENNFVIRVSWDAIKHSESYNIYRSYNSSRDFKTVATGVTSTSWIDESPLAGDNYYKICAIGHGTESRYYSQATDVVKYVLDIPNNVTATLSDDDFIVNLSWDAVKYAESYDVYRSSRPSSDFSKVTTVTSTSWTDEKPLSGNNYYRIYAKNKGVSSGASNTTNSVYVKYSLDAPTNVSALLLDDSFTIDVSWNAVKYAESYEIYRSNNYSGFSNVATVTTTSWIDENPLQGENYYRVRALGHGLQSNLSNATDAVEYALDVPANVSALWLDNSSSIKVSWNAVKHAESYDVYRSKYSSRDFKAVATGVTSTSWIDGDPLVGDNYYKIDAIGHGTESRSLSEVTNAVEYVLGIPMNVTAVLSDDDFIVNLSWDAVKYAESYDVYRSSNSSSGFVKVATRVTSTFWVDEEPFIGNNYYRVYAIGHGLTSNSSATISVTIINHPRMIDLGLPSGTKWASCNVGASKPEDFGGYFAWGETEEKNVYSENTYKYYQNDKFVSLGSDISGTEYDVAHVKWGGKWCMPTLDDIKELLDNCTSEWTTLNGVNGRKFTSKINGNSIFLPAAGLRWRGDLYYAGEDGYYWSSTQYPDLSGGAYYLDFYSGTADWGYGSRLNGQSVRPVVRN